MAKASASVLISIHCKMSCLKSWKGKRGIGFIKVIDEKGSVENVPLATAKYQMLRGYMAVHCINLVKRILLAGGLAATFSTEPIKGIIRYLFDL